PLERVARQSPSWGVRSQALDALKAIGPEGLPTIVTAIHDPDKNVRDYAIKLLASYGKPGVPALIADLNEPWNASSERALDALDSLDREALPALSVLARRATDAPDPVARRLAIGALAKIGPEAFPTVERLVKDPDPIVSAAAQRALVSMQRRFRR